MKKITLTLSCLLSLTLMAQSTQQIADDGTVVTTAPSIAPTGYHNPNPMACDTLASTFAGGNNHRGNMFDLSAVNTVTIISFDGHPMANTDYEIYHKSGTYVGNENNSGAWTLVGSATNVTAQPMGTPTPLPIPINVVIAGGQVEAFYVTSTNTTISQYYTNGTSVGNVFSSTADLQFTEGCGLEYPFSGSPFTPRVWNGVIHYCQGASGIEEEVNAANNSSVYPNPFSQNAVITLYQPVLNSMVTVNITDVLGHTVQSQSATGQNEFKISRSSLESGIYLYTIMNGNTLIGKGRFVIE